MTLRPFLPIALLCCAVALWSAPPKVVEKQATLTAPGSTSLQGVSEPGTEVNWSFEVKAGKQGRVRLVKGRGEVSCDLYDGEGLAANEGVAEEDWFPVAGRYKLTVSNVTGLGKGKNARSAAYEIVIEIR